MKSPPRTALLTLVAGACLAVMLSPASGEPAVDPAARSVSGAAGAADAGSVASWSAGACWPGQLVTQADERLRTEAAGSARAADLQRIREAAARTAALIRERDLRLYRTSFEPATLQAAGLAPEPAAALLGRAALGDATAAWHIAQSLPEGHAHRLGWMELAEALGDGRAASALALHYRRDARPLLAAQHAAQAEALGQVEPAVLDHRRK